MCSGCKLTVDSFLLMNNDELLEFLYQHGCLLKTKLCEECNQPCTVYAKKSADQNKPPELYFRCRRHRTIENNKKKKKVVCTFMQSIRKNTFFSGSHLSIRDICKFVLFEIIGVEAMTVFLENEIGIARHTAIDWRHFMREIYLDWAAGVNCGKIGGKDKIVEIDESLVGKRKNNCGRIVNGTWIFGGYERDSKKFFIVPVLDRSASTLTALIKEHIEDGTTIYSDCWKAYSRLEEHGFKHLTVNHSQNFVDPESGAHTQSVERLWGIMKSKIPKNGRKKGHLPGYLAAFVFKKYLPDHKDKIHTFFTAMGNLYNPKKELELSENLHFDECECKN